MEKTSQPKRKKFKFVLINSDFDPLRDQMQGQRDSSTELKGKSFQGKKQNNLVKESKEAESAKKQSRSGARKGGRSRNKGRGSNGGKKDTEHPRDRQFSVNTNPGNFLESMFWCFSSN